MAAPTATLVIAGVGAFVGSYLASRLALVWLTHRQIIDHPNIRSSHTRPVPRGGGIGFVVLLVIALGAVAIIEDSLPFLMLAGFVLLALTSFVDDARSLSFRIRLVFQLVAVALALAALPAETTIIAEGLPIWLDRLIAGLAWIWFINLFNFMDGIDGIAAGEAMVVAAGIAVLALVQPALGDAALPGVVIAAAAAGFLLLNWHPAKLFMGDIGSTGFGFLLGWFLIEAAGAGYLAAALILPMFFLLDASSTLIWRAVRRQHLATAHRDHAYQAAVDRGLSHATVSASVIALGLVLIGLALWSADAPIVATAVALALSGGLAAWMRWGGQRAPSAR